MCGSSDARRAGHWMEVVKDVPLKDHVVVYSTPAVDPAELHIDEIFSPNRFDVLTILKALNVREHCSCLVQSRDLVLTLSPRKDEKPASATVTNSRKAEKPARRSLICSRKSETSAWKFRGKTVTDNVVSVSFRSGDLMLWELWGERVNLDQWAFMRDISTSVISLHTIVLH